MDNPRYLLAKKSSDTFAADEQLWLSRRGVYNVINGFGPYYDGDGNLICGLADGENNAFPFADELKQCEKIEYKPKSPNQFE